MLPPFVKLCDSVIVRLKLISTAEKMVDPNCFHGIVSHLAVFFHSGKQSLPILLPTSYFFYRLLIPLYMSLFSTKYIT